LAFESEKLLEDLKNGTSLPQGFLRHIDPSIGDIPTLEKAVEMFKNTPGALTKDEPITRLIKCGADIDKIGIARGSAYELETAYKLKTKGEEVIKIGEKIAGRDFDIITQTKLIECKAIDWNKMPVTRMDKMKSTYCDQLRISTELEKVFEIHSKTSIPNAWKEWFIKKGLTFIEG
jgi:hypothetical protein